MKQVRLVAVGVAAIVALAWWGFSSEAPRSRAQRLAQAKKRLPGEVVAAAARTPSSPDAAVASSAVAQVTASDDEADEPDGLRVESVSDEEIERALKANAAFVERAIDRFCEVNEQLGNAKLFAPKQGGRDGTRELNKLFGRYLGDETVDLPMWARQSLLNGGDGLELTEAQLMGIQFGWMRRMRDYDRFSLDDGPGFEGVSTPSMSVEKLPRYAVQLRVLRAAKLNDWEDTRRDIQALADLYFSAGTPRSQALAGDLLRIEAQTIARLEAQGVRVPQLGAPDVELAALYRSMAGDLFRFVTPGVSLETQKRALECARRSGLQCALKVASNAQHAQLDELTETPALSFDEGGCNAFVLQHPSTYDKLPHLKATIAELLGPSETFGPVDAR